MLRGRRKRLPHFGDQIYSVLALSQLARIRDDGDARDAARSIGDLLLENQMPNGAWPWIYDPLRGTVVEPYELYSVHQDSMAMIGMHGLSEATGEPRYRDVAVRGLDWNYGGNELGAQMFDPEAGMIYRSIRRKQRFARARQARNAAATYLRAAPRLADPEELEVNRAMRPDHLGWLLEAWAGREHLARTGGLMAELRRVPAPRRPRRGPDRAVRGLVRGGAALGAARRRDGPGDRRRRRGARGPLRAAEGVRSRRV